MDQLRIVCWSLQAQAEAALHHVLKSITNSQELICELRSSYSEAWLGSSLYAHGCRLMLISIYQLLSVCWSLQAEAEAATQALHYLLKFPINCHRLLHDMRTSWSGA